MSELLLSAQNISKTFGDQTVIAFGRLDIYGGERIGIIGRNGSGKTTLLKLLSGKLAPDTGFIRPYAPVICLEQLSTPFLPCTPYPSKRSGGPGAESIPYKSGGEIARLQLAAIESEDGVLLADEPTANLDQEGIELCCRRLEKCKALLLVSHDRQVLDRMCSSILLIQDGSLYRFPGNYTEFERRQAEHIHQKWGQYRDYSREKKRLELAVSRQAQKSSSVRKAPSRMGNSEARLHRRAAQEKSEKLSAAGKAIQARLERLEAVEKPREAPDVHMDFSLTFPPVSKAAILGEGISVCFGRRVIFENASFRIPTGSKTALIAPNGAGKTTLLRQIAGAKNGIRIAPHGKIGWFQQELLQFKPERTLLENVMEGCVQSESVMRGILARMLLTEDDWGKEAGTLSGGQRVKMFLARMIGSPCNILLLDEPTNFLDLPSIAALEEMICSYPGTVLFVSHDRRLIDRCASRILRIENRALHAFEGNLSQWEEQRTHARATPEEIDQAVLEMQISRVLSQLSFCQGKEKQALEEEFQRLLTMRKSRFR